MLVFKPERTQNKTFCILKMMLIDLVTYYQHNSTQSTLYGFSLNDIPFTKDSLYSF